MRRLRAVGRFWADFLIGDDWRIAAGVVAALGGGAAAVRADVAAEGVICVLVASAIVAVVVVSVAFAGRWGRSRP